MKTVPIQEITLRDYFAAKAMQGMVVEGEEPRCNYIAKIAYEMADGKRFTNGDPAKNPDHLSSQEIHACADKTILVDEQCLEIRKQHGGKFV